MIFHIQQEHPHIKLKCSLNDAATTVDSIQTSLQAKPKQTTLSSFCRPQQQMPQMSITKHQKLEKTLMALFVDKMLPLSLLEHASFKAFVLNWILVSKFLAD